jgi:hypothetical protein
MTYPNNLARLEDEKPDCHLQNWDKTIGCIYPAEQNLNSDLLFFLEVDSLSHMVPQAVDPSPNWLRRYSHHWIGFREQFTGDFNIQWEHPWFQPSFFLTNRVIKTILMLEDRFSFPSFNMFQSFVMSM